MQLADFRGKAREGYGNRVELHLEQAPLRAAGAVHVHHVVRPVNAQRDRLQEAQQNCKKITECFGKLAPNHTNAGREGDLARRHLFDAFL